MSLIIPIDYRTIPTSSYDKVVKEINLDSLIDFLRALPTEDWVPDAYFRKSTFDRVDYGVLAWCIYSYLISSGIVMIENKYFGTTYTTSDQKYISRISYDNKFETLLYYPIMDRLVEENYFTKDGYYYCLNKSYKREDLLKDLGIHES